MIIVGIFFVWLFLFLVAEGLGGNTAALVFALIMLIVFLALGFG